MYTDDNNSNNDKDGEEKKKYTINDKKKIVASKPSTSPKEKLELGKVLKVEIGEIRAIMIAALVIDFFVLLSNQRF